MERLFLILSISILVSSVAASTRKLQQGQIQYVYADGTPAYVTTTPTYVTTTAAPSVVAATPTVVTTTAGSAADLFGPAPPKVVESPPTALECGAALETISLDDIQNQITPCVFGVVDSCCDRLAPLFKIGEKVNSPLEGCLCNELILTETVREIENVPITELVGFDGIRFMTVLQGCGINFFFGEGEATCPGIIPASLVGGGGGDDDDDDDDDGRRQQGPRGPSFLRGPLLGIFG